jgi:hypothetical protein
MPGFDGEPVGSKSSGTKNASLGLIAYALNTENGVSNCDGRLVKPIIGPFFRGYLTIGRSLLSNNSATAFRANFTRQSGDRAKAAPPAKQCFGSSSAYSLGKISPAVAGQAQSGYASRVVLLPADL